MKRFLEYITEDKNTHMTHIEDQVLYGGVSGARDAILALRSLRNMLAGTAQSDVGVTVKWDGAPAVFAGIDPSDGEFFVAKKGIFNKDPKVYKSVKDVQADTSGDLQKKLIIAYNELKNLGIKGVIQGDIMFTKDDLKSENINGVKHVTFHPNTLVYAVPANSELGQQISTAEIGVVWHTSYEGKDFESMKASFNKDITASLKSTPRVWSHSAKMPALSGQAGLSDEEASTLNAALSKAGQIFNQISSNTLKQIEANQSFAQTLETFNNTLVRAGEKIEDPRKHVDDLIDWATARHDKEIASRSSERGKEAAQGRKDAYMEFFSDENKEALAKIYELQNAIVAAKEIVIDKLDALKSIQTFIKTKDGFKVTGQEGFVAIKGDGAVKLVDRLQFSTNNFNPDVIKGWDK